MFLQTHFILPEYLMQKDQTVNLDEAKDKLKQAGVPEDEMAALERQLAPAVDNAVAKERKVGFVSAGVESQTDGGLKTSANHEDIELPEEDEEDDDDDKIEIAQKDVPSAVFGGLLGKRDESEENGEVDGAKDKDNESRLGALERIKRLKRN